MATETRRYIGEYDRYIVTGAKHKRHRKTEYCAACNAAWWCLQYVRWARNWRASILRGEGVEFARGMLASSLEKARERRERARAFGFAKSITRANVPDGKKIR